MQAELTTLKTLPLFSALTQEESNLIACNSQLRHCKRGKFLFMHGEPISHFFIICRGAVQVFRETPDGHEVTSDMLIAGDSINANEIITRQTLHSMNARAIDDSLLLEIPVTWMREHLNNFDHMSAQLIAALSDRLLGAQIEAEHQSTMSAAQIVACYFHRLYQLYGQNGQNGQGFKLPYSKTLIASRLRMELSTFSRTLKRLADEGITVKGSQVLFTDKKKSSHFVCDSCSLIEDCPAHAHLHQTQGNSPPQQITPMA